MAQFESYPFGEAEEKSPRWQQIVKWFDGYGIASKIVTSENKVPGAEYFKEYVVAFSRPGQQDSRHDAGLVLRAPTLTMTHLQVEWVFGDPTQPIWFDYVREVPQGPAPPTPLPPQPGDPVGAEIQDDIPGNYYAVSGDTSPNGTIFTRADGASYRKVVKLTPFGPRMYWVKA